MIRLNSLTIGYREGGRGKVVAQNITGNIYSGELTCIIGSNGVGKSTLIRTLSGFQKKISGDIILNDKDIDEFSDKELSHVIGIVLTERFDFRNMSVEDLIGMGRSPYTNFWGRLRDCDKQIVRRCAKMVGVENLLQRPAHTLSDGERQKVMIAKALAQETSIIFLDEPTAFLDYKSKVEIMQLLHNLCRTEDKIIFLSSHDLDLVLQISDKIWLMNNGVLSVGTPEDLALDGSLKEFFKGDGMTFDLSSGLFTPRFTTKSKVCVKGDETVCRLVAKALKRNGILATHNTDSDIVILIEAYTNNYTIKTKTNKQITVYNIHSLLNVLLNLKINPIKSIVNN